jgi:hypothetical protein
VPGERRVGWAASSFCAALFTVAPRVLSGKCRSGLGRRPVTGEASPACRHLLVLERRSECGGPPPAVVEDPFAHHGIGPSRPSPPRSAAATSTSRWCESSASRPTPRPRGCCAPPREASAGVHRFASIAVAALATAALMCGRSARWRPWPSRGDNGTRVVCRVRRGRP